MTAPRRRPFLVAGLAVGVTAGGGSVLASPALAADVTNPATHPASVTLTIDGQQYQDGLDTLPGFDDYACTPIPGVEYDFASNRVLYYDGSGSLLDTAKWTEWERTTSYKTWAEQQAKASAPATPTPSTSSGAGAESPAPSTAAAATPSPSASTSTPATPSPSASPGTSSSSTSRPAASSSGSPAPSKPKGSATASTGTSKASGPSKGTAATSTGGAATSGVAAGTTPGGTASPGAKGTAASTSGSASDDANLQEGSEPPAAVAGPPAPQGVTPAQGSAPLASAVSEAGRGAGDTRLAGVGILGALSLAALALLSGNFIRRGPLSRVAKSSTS